MPPRYCLACRHLRTRARPAAAPPFWCFVHVMATGLYHGCAAWEAAQ